MSTVSNLSEVAVSPGQSTWTPGLKAKASGGNGFKRVGAGVDADFQPAGERSSSD